MKLTLQIKLLPNKDQGKLLLDTLKRTNAACNVASEIAWDENCFNQIKLHHLVYHPIKTKFNLSAQVVVRLIAKCIDAYKLDRKSKRVFRPLGGITYDERILSYNIADQTVSIWTTGGRLKALPFVCHNKKMLPYIQGEADLIYKNSKWYLFQTVEVPEDKIKDVEDFIGVDFGLVYIATLSTGTKMSGKELEAYRIQRQKIRSSLQSKGTKNAKRVLKRLSGKERRTASIVNHTIAKRIIRIAKRTGRGIALENLKGIRNRTSDKGKKFRTRIGRWNFSDLRAKIEYKARLAGIPVVIVNPAYTSQTCSQCLHIGSRKGESFKCGNCGYSAHADVNGAKNIRSLGASVNRPEEAQAMSCCLHSA